MFIKIESSDQIGYCNRRALLIRQSSLWRSEHKIITKLLSAFYLVAKVLSIFSIIWLVSLARDVALIFPNFPSHPSALPVLTDLTYITYKMHQDGYKISQAENDEAYVEMQKLIIKRRFITENGLASWVFQNGGIWAVFIKKYSLWKT